MIALDKDLIESFCLEIIANSVKVTKDVKKISVHEFSCNSSKEILNIIHDISSSIVIATENLYKDIDWEDKMLFSSKIRQLKRLKDLIQLLASHLEYIENSKMDKIPWALIEPFQKIASSIIVNSKIVLCQQWKYNYSIITTNIFDFYLTKIELLEEFIPEELYEKLNNKLDKPLYLISFPYLEKNNILLYSLLGHEVGHLVADNLIGELKPNILKDIEKDLKNIFQQIQEKKEEVSYATFLDYCKEVWERLFVELLSDVVGSLIFGPAMLFSMFEFSMQYNMDDVPDRRTQFYPPWRTRLRIILKIISNFIPSLNDIKSDIFTEHDLKKRLLQIKKVVENTRDIEEIKKVH